MAFSTLSVLISCYNEEATIEELVRRVLAADTLGLSIEIVIVDDGSRDESAAIIKRMAEANPVIKGFYQGMNRGKGAALRHGFAQTTGDIVLIQDADLEYSPANYPRLLKPILDGRADVVFGSRFKSGQETRVLFFWHSLANKGLTLLSNMLTDLTLTHMETCYKVFARWVVQGIRIEEDRFGFEPEITARIAHMEPRPRIYEVGISYSGRTYKEGKKIGWKDGVRAIWCILRYNLVR